MSKEFIYFIKNGTESIPVDVRTVFNISMDGGSPVFCFLDKPKQRCSKSLNAIADDLHQWDFFMLVHKSHIANLHKVNTFNKKKGAKMDNEKWLAIARDKYDCAMERKKNLKPIPAV